MREEEHILMTPPKQHHKPTATNPTHRDPQKDSRPDLLTQLTDKPAQMIAKRQRPNKTKPHQPLTIKQMFSLLYTGHPKRGRTTPEGLTEQCRATLRVPLNPQNNRPLMW